MTAPKTLEEKAQEWLDEHAPPSEWQRKQSTCASLAALLADGRNALKAEALRVVEEEQSRLAKFVSPKGPVGDAVQMACNQIRARLEAL